MFANSSSSKPPWPNCMMIRARVRVGARVRVRAKVRARVRARVRVSAVAVLHDARELVRGDEAVLVGIE